MFLVKQNRVYLRSKKQNKTRLIVTVTVKNLRPVLMVIKFANGKQIVKTGIKKMPGLDI